MAFADYMRTADTIDDNAAIDPNGPPKGLLMPSRYEVLATVIDTANIDDPHEFRDTFKKVLEACHMYDDAKFDAPDLAEEIFRIVGDGWTTVQFADDQGAGITGRWLRDQES